MSGSFERNLSIFNSSGTLTELAIDSSTLQNAANGSGALIETRGNAVATAIVTGSTFPVELCRRHSGIRACTVQSDVAGTGRDRRQSFTSNNEGVLCSNNTDARATCEISNNTFTGQLGNAIFVGNGIGTTNLSVFERPHPKQQRHHAAGGDNHTVQSFFGGTGAVSNLVISGNTVNNNGNFDGIHVNTPDMGSSPIFNVTVLSNNVTTAASGVNAINLNARQSSTACFNVRLNTTAAPSGIGVQVRQVAPAVASLERGTSASNTASTVLADNNPAAAGQYAELCGRSSNGGEQHNVRRAAVSSHILQVHLWNKGARNDGTLHR